MKNIGFSIDDNVPADSSDDALRIDGFGNRIRIDVRNFNAQQDELSFDLMIGYQLAYEYGKGVQNVLNAMVLSLEQPAAGAAGALRLGDPDVRPVAPNFSGEPPAGDSASAFFGGSYGLKITAFGAPLESAPIYLRVCLQRIVSNCLAIDPVTASSVDYEEK